MGDRPTFPPPAGWPERVPAPGTPDWEIAASKWLIDQCPGAWREGLSGQVHRKHTLMLARDTRYLINAQIQGLRDAYSRARVELGDHYEPQQIEEQLAMYAEEGQRLKDRVKAVQPVEDALTGVRWIPRGDNTEWSKLG
ncbi:hypothetical protein [Streptacidiphilus rugosus]|uniref:hypothetical protein n=1 Tax=Streptacidiphilus rugosus TaxID=405783 RepID=UPI00055C96B9|nr:hypothetical protein [Streptacidiphilus rugosus]